MFITVGAAVNREVKFITSISNQLVCKSFKSSIFRRYADAAYNCNGPLHHRGAGSLISNSVFLKNVWDFDKRMFLRIEVFEKPLYHDNFPHAERISSW